MKSLGRTTSNFSILAALIIPLGLGVWTEVPAPTSSDYALRDFADCRYCFEHDWIIYREHAFYLYQGGDPVWYGGELHNYYKSKLCWNGCRGAHYFCPWVEEEEEEDAKHLVHDLFTTDDLIALKAEHPETFEYYPSRRIIQIRSEECSEMIIAYRKVSESTHLQLIAEEPGL